MSTYTLARRDGTDLRTGATSLVAGQVAAPAQPMRLGDPCDLLRLGTIDDPDGVHTPWRLVEVETEVEDRARDHAEELDSHAVARRARVLGERPFLEALGLDTARAAEVAARARALLREPWFGRRSTPMSDDAVLALARSAYERMTLAASPTGTPHPCSLVRVRRVEVAELDALARQMRYDHDYAFEHAYMRETGATMGDVVNIARATRDPAFEAARDAISDLQDAIAHDEPDATAPLRLSTVIACDLGWQLAAPMLELANPFEPLAELVLAGVYPWAMLQEELVVYEVR